MRLLAIEDQWHRGSGLPQAALTLALQSEEIRRSNLSSPYALCKRLLGKLKFKKGK